MPHHSETMTALEAEMCHAQGSFGTLTSMIEAATLIEQYSSKAYNALRSTSDPSAPAQAADALLATACVAMRALIGLNLTPAIPARTPPSDPEQDNADNGPRAAQPS